LRMASTRGRDEHSHRCQGSGQDRHLAA